MEKNETPKNLALLTADEVALSILEVDAEGVRIKLWPDVNAVRAHLEECCKRMPGGLAGYSVRHYVCGRYLYCAVALADITKDAPLPQHLPREQRRAHQRGRRQLFGRCCRLEHRRGGAEPAAAAHPGQQGPHRPPGQARHQHH